MAPVDLKSEGLEAYKQRALADFNEAVRPSPSAPLPSSPASPP